MTRCLILTTLLIVTSSLALADGGALILRGHAGSVDVTVFAAPSPLRVGPADFSLLIQESQTQDVLLDGEVELVLSKAGAEDIKVSPTPGQATNRLLYAATLSIPEPGTWKLTARYRLGGQDARVSGSVTVLPPEPPLLSYWQYFVIVPAAISLFLLNQLLKARRRSAKVTRKA